MRQKIKTQATLSLQNWELLSQTNGSGIPSRIWISVSQISSKYKAMSGAKAHCKWQAGKNQELGLYSFFSECHLLSVRDLENKQAWSSNQACNIFDHSVLDFTWCWNYGKAPGNSYDVISPSNVELSIEVTDSDRVQTLGLSLHCGCCDTIGTKATEERSDSLTVPALSPSWQSRHGGSGFRELVIFHLRLIIKIANEWLACEYSGCSLHLRQCRLSNPANDLAHD